MIGSIVEATLPLMRAHAESLMLDRCRVDRPSTSWSEAEQ